MDVVVVRVPGFSFLGFSWWTAEHPEVIRALLKIIFVALVCSGAESSIFGDGCFSFSLLFCDKEKLGGNSLLRVRCGHGRECEAQCIFRKDVFLCSISFQSEGC